MAEKVVDSGRREFLLRTGPAVIASSMMPSVLAAGEASSRLPAASELFSGTREALLSAGVGGVDEKYVDGLLKSSRMPVYPNLRRALTRPPERLTYDEYRSPRVAAIDRKIEDGPTFLRKYGKQLAAAEKKFGVDRMYVLGLLGLESDYGRYLGDYNPVGVFATMIDAVGVPKWERFGKKEVVELVKFCKPWGIDPHTIRSSRAGAVTPAQFLFSSLNDPQLSLYASDPDFVSGKRFPNLSSMDQGIENAAHYLSRWREDGGPGWQLGAKPDERAGNTNWRALMAYNPSKYYGWAIVEIAEGIRASQK